MDFLICNKLIRKKNWVLLLLVNLFKNHGEDCGFSLTLPLHNKLGFSNFESAKCIGPSVHMYLSSNSSATTLITNTVGINSQVFSYRMEYRTGGKSNGVDIVTPNNRRKSNHKVFE